MWAGSATNYVAPPPPETVVTWVYHVATTICAAVFPDLDEFPPRAGQAVKPCHVPELSARAVRSGAVRLLFWTSGFV